MKSAFITRAKSVLLIVATLLIGAVIGALVHARIMDQRFNRLAALRSHAGFVRFIDRSIDFESPEQRKAVHDIVDGASTRLFEHMQRSRREMAAILDSTRDALSKVLTDDQMKQLEKRLMRHRRGRMRFGPDDRPPRDGARDRPPEGPPSRGPGEDGPPGGPPPD